MEIEVEKTVEVDVPMPAETGQEEEEMYAKIREEELRRFEEANGRTLFLDHFRHVVTDAALKALHPDTVLVRRTADRLTFVLQLENPILGPPI